MAVVSIVFYRVATAATASVAAASVPIGICVAATCWAEARVQFTRMTLTIKLDRNWSSFQLANSAPPLSVTGSAIAPSARIARDALFLRSKYVSDYTLPLLCTSCCRDTIHELWQVQAACARWGMAKIVLDIAARKNWGNHIDSGTAILLVATTSVPRARDPTRTRT